MMLDLSLQNRVRSAGFFVFLGGSVKTNHSRPKQVGFLKYAPERGHLLCFYGFEKITPSENTRLNAMSFALILCL